MAHLQLIRHQLVRMLTVRLAQILVQHYSMADSQATIHAIYKQEDQISHITSRDDHLTDQEQQDESNADRSHITSKALSLTLRTEIENAENKQNKPS